MNCCRVCQHDKVSQADQSKQREHKDQQDKGLHLNKNRATVGYSNLACLRCCIVHCSGIATIHSNTGNAIRWPTASNPISYTGSASFGCKGWIKANRVIQVISTVYSSKSTLVPPNKCHLTLHSCLHELCQAAWPQGCITTSCG